MFLTGAQAAEQVDPNTLLVVVDVNRPSITEAPELLKMVKTIVVLDHHRQGGETVERATLSYIEPYASSACEMVAEILQYFSDDLKLKRWRRRRSMPESWWTQIILSVKPVSVPLRQPRSCAGAARI